MRLQSTKPYFCAVGWGVSIKLVALPHLLIALGIEVEILLLFAKDCNGKPDLKGNALKLNTFVVVNFTYKVIMRIRNNGTYFSLESWLVI